MCPVYYFNIKINLDIYNYLGLFFKYNNDLDSINQSLMRKIVHIRQGTGVPILEKSGNLCILQYTNVEWTPSDMVPEQYRSLLENGVWTNVTTTNNNDGAIYRLCIQQNGLIVVQKNGANLTTPIFIRGQIAWVI